MSSGNAKKGWSEERKQKQAERMRLLNEARKKKGHEKKEKEQEKKKIVTESLKKSAEEHKCDTSLSILQLQKEKKVMTPTPKDISKVQSGPVFLDEKIQVVTQSCDSAKYKVSLISIFDRDSFMAECEILTGKNAGDVFKNDYSYSDSFLMRDFIDDINGFIDEKEALDDILRKSL